MVFDDGHILDDDLREVLVQNATKNVMPMGSTEENQTAKQMTVDSISQGIFSFFPGKFTEQTRRSMRRIWRSTSIRAWPDSTKEWCRSHQACS
jgi:hypothetical protein